MSQLRISSCQGRTSPWATCSICLRRRTTSGGPAQETPEGHAVRIDAQGRITHLTAINAKWLLTRDGELIATLRDGRRLRLSPDDLAGLIH